MAHYAWITIVLETTVHDIIDLPPVKKSVSTSKRIITAGKVIVATNAYTGAKERFGLFLRRRLVPVQSAIIVTEHLGQKTVPDLIPKLRMYDNTVNLYTYFRPTPDHDRILLFSRNFDTKVLKDRTQRCFLRRLTDYSHRNKLTFTGWAMLPSRVVTCYFFLSTTRSGTPVDMPDPARCWRDGWVKSSQRYTGNQENSQRFYDHQQKNPVPLRLAKVHASG